MSLVTQIAALAARVAAEIKLLRTEIPPALPAYTPTQDGLTNVLTPDSTTGVLQWTTTPTFAYLDTTYDLRVSGMTVGLGGGQSGTNIAMGTGALEVNTTGYGLCAVGAYALTKNLAGVMSTAVGYSALGEFYGSGGYNTAVGTLAGQSLTAGSHNTFIGTLAGSNMEGGNSNTLIGRWTGGAVGTSFSNCIGISAGLTLRLFSDSTGKWGFGTGTSALTAGIETQGDSIRIRTASTPASATDVGEPGTFRWDATAVHFCVDVNTWKSLPYSDFGATSPGGGGGTVGIPTYVQETEPAAPAIWYKTDASGSVIDILRVT